MITDINNSAYTNDYGFEVDENVIDTDFKKLVFAMMNMNYLFTRDNTTVNFLALMINTLIDYTRLRILYDLKNNNVSDFLSKRSDDDTFKNMLNKFLSCVNEKDDYKIVDYYNTLYENDYIMNFYIDQLMLNEYYDNMSGFSVFDIKYHQYVVNNVFSINREDNIIYTIYFIHYLTKVYKNNNIWFCDVNNNMNLNNDHVYIPNLSNIIDISNWRTELFDLMNDESKVKITIKETGKRSERKHKEKYIEKNFENVGDIVNYLNYIYHLKSPPIEDECYNTLRDYKIFRMINMKLFGSNKTLLGELFSMGEEQFTKLFVIDENKQFEVWLKTNLRRIKHALNKDDYISDLTKDVQDFETYYSEREYPIFSTYKRDKWNNFRKWIYEKVDDESNKLKIYNCICKLYDKNMYAVKKSEKELANIHLEADLNNLLNNIISHYDEPTKIEGQNKIYTYLKPDDVSKEVKSYVIENIANGRYGFDAILNKFITKKFITNTHYLKTSDVTDQNYKKLAGENNAKLTYLKNIFAYILEIQLETSFDANMNTNEYFNRDVSPSLWKRSKVKWLEDIDNIVNKTIISEQIVSDEASKDDPNVKHNIKLKRYKNTYELYKNEKFQVFDETLQKPRRESSKKTNPATQKRKREFAPKKRTAKEFAETMDMNNL